MRQVGNTICLFVLSPNVRAYLHLQRLENKTHQATAFRTDELAGDLQKARSDIDISF